MRRNIVIHDKEYKEIKNFAEKRRLSVSELLRVAVKKYMEIEEEMDLSEYLKANCDFVSIEEQNDIDQWIKELKSNDEYEITGREVTLEEILQG